MAEFETQTELQVAVDQRSLRSARQDIESELGDVTAGVESSADTRSMRSDGGGFGGAVGSDVADLQADQVDLLEDIEQHLDGMAGMGGGGGGGLPTPLVFPGGGGGGGIGGGSPLVSLLLSGAMTPGSPFFFGSGSQPDLDRISFAGEEGQSDFGPIMDIVQNQFIRPLIGAFGGGGLDLGPAPETPDPPPLPPWLSGEGGGGEGGGDFVANLTRVQSMLFNQTPSWVEQLRRTAQRLQALQPPGPANVSQDPSNFGQPEEGPLGPGSSGRQGQAGQAGRGNTQPVQGQFDVNISVEDRRDIDQEMRKIEERLRDALRGNGGGRF